MVWFVVIVVLLPSMSKVDSLSVGGDQNPAATSPSVTIPLLVPSSVASDDAVGNSVGRRKFLLRGVLVGGGGLMMTTITPSSNTADAAEPSTSKLTFQTLEGGVKFADIRLGDAESDVAAIEPNSKVNIHVTGRLLGKNGWIFENSQSEDEPYRLQLGTSTVVPGLEEGLMGMKVGGRRRIVVPSSQGYLNKQLEPIPREFSNRQRLYTTVFNSNRIDREREQLGQDLAGVVVFDVELLRIRK